MIFQRKNGRNQYLTDYRVGRETEISDQIMVTRRMIRQGIRDLCQGVSLGEDREFCFCSVEYESTVDSLGQLCCVLCSVTSFPS